MALNKRTYTEHETKITAQNLNEMQDEIIANGQRSNTNMNRLNAIGWTQEQIDAFKELLGITEHPEIDEPLFQPGDIYPNTTETWFGYGGYIETTNNMAYVSIPLPKSLKNINTITFVPNSGASTGVLIANASGYAESSWIKEGETYSFETKKLGNYMFRFDITKSSAWTNAVRRSPCSMNIRGNFVFS